jgi:OHCU decarboxylase
MIQDLNGLNSLQPAEAEKAFLQCCGSKRWAQEMTAARPYRSGEELIANANDIWWTLQPDDWLEAFRSHPKIGEKKAASPVSEQSREWSGKEQAGVSKASRETLDDLATLNRIYEQKFGFIFVICATGKSSEEMLTALRQRLDNEPAVELPIAAAEQSKITELRLKKLITCA